MLAALITFHLLAGSAPPDALPLEAPGVDYRVAVAGATAAPWLNANGWRYLQNPGRPFLADVKGTALPLAMAEAFAWRGNTWFQVADGDRSAFDKTLSFFEALPQLDVTPRVQIGVDDDGTPEVGEVLKLLIRRNLMVAPLPKGGSAPALMVKLDTPDYPRESAKNPAAFAAGVRARLGDDARQLRIYGSDVVLGRFEAGQSHARIHLLNYSNRDVHGARVRVLGQYRLDSVHALNQPDLAPMDFAVTAGATEFTIPVLTRYAVVDLLPDVPFANSKEADRDFKLTADPRARHWQSISPVIINKDFLGQPVPLPPTEVRSRWTRNNLYLLFSCPFEQLTLKPNPATAAETPKLWNWDVAEVFLGSDHDHTERYHEFQVSPQGEWVDLDIDRAHPKPDGGIAWNSRFEVKARIDAAHKIWYGEMRIPLASFSPAVSNELRVGMFRIDGAAPNRHYLAWQPTNERNFHVPQAFGVLRLQP